MNRWHHSITSALLLASVTASAQPVKELPLKVEGIESDGMIAPEFAFCIPANTDHVKAGPDKSLGVSWAKGPESTKSYALIMVDTDVPTSFENAGQEGKTISAELERKSFYHWILYDIPATQSQIRAFSDSQAIVQHGKSELKTPYGMRGINDYAPYFASDPERKGVYAGYDGPCPPWNDERIHHYHVKLFALDVPSLKLNGPATGPQVMDALARHILAQGETVGKYTLNPELMKSR